MSEVDVTGNFGRSYCQPKASEAMKQAVRDAGITDAMWHVRDGELVPFVRFVPATTQGIVSPDRDDWMTSAERRYYEWRQAQGT